MDQGAFAVGDGVKIVIPEETHPDKEMLDGCEGTVVGIICDETVTAPYSYFSGVGVRVSLHNGSRLVVEEELVTSR